MIRTLTIWLLHCFVFGLGLLTVQAHTHPPEKAAELAVSAAFDTQGSLWVVGSHRPGELYLQRVLEQGKPLNEPKRIIKLSGDRVSASGENRPKIKFGPKGQLLISYTKPLSRPYTGEIRMIRSVDGGMSFSQPFTVHQDRQEITHRFESIIFDHQGVLHTFWIDKRDQELIRRSKNLNHRDLAKHYRGAAIYRNESMDAGLSFGPDIKVADHSCECCRIALTLDNKGKPVAMWRHVFEPNFRDHALWRFAAPESMQRASQDQWQLDACPHHGPSIAPASDGGFHALWYGERDGRATVRYGRLNAEGSALGTPIELPDANAEHADIFRQASMLFVTWQFFDGKRSVWKAWVSDDEGKQFNTRVLGVHAGKHDYPLIVGSPSDGVWGIWNTDQGLRLLRLDP
ncbi:MAG: hypothetical protein EB036_03400 [Betaproteobacteria bacterium]|jgi:hypothetical protein|nr:hypothetical protein [Pseudomonadota bacterium]NBO95635.1 hypothetical protein [Betaproteobacteria bacterium]HAB47085.1 hypothetical protein [Lautropia sp.]NBP34652.1 hypothetical protein [Betaproteobacteria bacterium]NBP38837.1 hypothetical protein [Betaproteobacteria bacterium]